MSRLAAVLFYSLVKNHPFRNGNKRIAVMTSLVFLFLNDKWISASTASLYEIARYVSNSLPKDRNKALKHLEGYMRSNMQDV
ncbi:MAG: type II toxin-antitoxin system death-on-curing family toxin [bacterium]|nr:type II toxin-antitoxin system death-on-curing family toxin [bacterium]